MSTLLTVKQAMKRVRRSKRTLETWIADGLPIIWISNVRHVRERELLAELRRRNAANPARGWKKPPAEVSAGRVQDHLARKYGA